VFIFATVLFKLGTALWNSFPNNVKRFLHVTFPTQFFMGFLKCFNMCSLTRFEVLTAGLLKISLMGYYSVSLVNRY